MALQRLSLLAALALPARGLSLQGSAQSSLRGSDSEEEGGSGALQGRVAVQQIGKIHIVTVETRAGDPFRLPGRTPGAGDTPMVTNVGAGHEWHFYRTKNGLMLDWIKEARAKDPDTMAIMIDGSDMILGGCDERFIMSKYKDILQASGGGKDMKLVMSAETACFPHEMDWHFRDNASWESRRSMVNARVGGLPDDWVKPWAPCRDYKKAPCDKEVAYRYPNWGWVMGPVKSLEPLFEFVYNNGTRRNKGGGPTENFDQARAQWWMLWNFEKITLDYTGSLVLSMHQMAFGRPDRQAPVEIKKDWKGRVSVHNKILNQPCCFAHGNGDAEGMVTRMMRKMARLPGGSDSDAPAPA